MRLFHSRPSDAEDAIPVVAKQVAGKFESVDERAGRRCPIIEDQRHVALVVHGVMADFDVLRSGADQHEPGSARGRVRRINSDDVVGQVVADEDVVGLPARMVVVVATDVEDSGDVPHDVVLERDVPHDRPRCGAFLIARRKSNRVAPRPASQLFSKMFPSMSTFCAFFSSSRLMSAQFCVFHAVGFVNRLRRIVILDGTRFAIPDRRRRT